MGDARAGVMALPRLRNAGKCMATQRLGKLGWAYASRQEKHSRPYHAKGTRRRAHTRGGLVWVTPEQG